MLGNANEWCLSSEHLNVTTTPALSQIDVSRLPKTRVLRGGGTFFEQNRFEVFWKFENEMFAFGFSVLRER